jgi:3,4-dihydroxy 2-butanone 4-phosphate synthase/GTP cyclohydrolase II
MADPLEGLWRRIPVRQQTSRRPSLTLSYAQSLDGSIAAQDRRPLPLSSPESLAVTHRLRAIHEAILVGIGTVLADNPRLTARGAGDDQQPQPIVLDSRLRLPLDSALLRHPRPPILAAVPGASLPRRQELEAAGARVLDMPANPEGLVDLPALLDRLGQLGIGSIMAEGGARVITNLLKAQLADGIVLTLALVMAGGLHGVGALPHQRLAQMPHLRDPGSARVGPDLLVWGELAWPEY